MNLWRVWVYRTRQKREAPNSAVWLVCAWDKDAAREKVRAVINAMGYQPESYRIGKTVRLELGAYDAREIAWLD